jgi:hypothetical protein
MVAQKRNQEDLIRQLTAKSGRSCGECSMCCKILPIEEADFKKPGSEWCHHCRPGNGCTIYASRPPICRGFACLWLINGELPEHWRPNNSGMVLALTSEPRENLVVHVDAASPLAWQQDPYRSELGALSRELLRCGLHTIIKAGTRRWVVLPDRAVEVAGPYLILPVGEDRWQLFQFTDKAEAQKFVKGAQQFHRMGVKEREELMEKTAAHKM